MKIVHRREREIDRDVVDRYAKARRDTRQVTVEIIAVDATRCIGGGGVVAARAEIADHENAERARLDRRRFVAFIGRDVQ